MLHFLTSFSNQPKAFSFSKQDKIFINKQIQIFLLNVHFIKKVCFEAKMFLYAFNALFFWNALKNSQTLPQKYHKLCSFFRGKNVSTKNMFQAKKKVWEWRQKFRIHHAVTKKLCFHKFLCAYCAVINALNAVPHLRKQNRKTALLNKASGSQGSSFCSFRLLVLRVGKGNA